MSEGTVPVPCGTDAVVGTNRAGTELSLERTEEGRFRVQEEWSHSALARWGCAVCSDC